MMQVDEATSLSEVDLLRKQLAESEKRNKELELELKQTHNKFYLDFWNSLPVPIFANPLYFIENLGKTPMSARDLRVEELEQQVLRLTRELEEARAIATTPQSLLSEEKNL